MNPRMHEFRGFDDVVVGREYLAADPLEATAPGFQVGNPDHVVIRQRDRDLARGLDGQRMAISGIPAGDGGDAIEVVVGIGDILIVHQATQAGLEHVVGRGGEVPGDAF